MAEKVPIAATAQDSESQGAKEPRIRRGRVDSLTLYEITDEELSILERGSPGSTYFSFSVFLLSVAVSFLTALTTSKIDSDRVFTVYVVLIALGFVLGSLCMILWWRNRSTTGDVVARIKKRVPPGEDAEGPPAK